MMVVTFTAALACGPRGPAGVVGGAGGGGGEASPAWLHRVSDLKNLRAVAVGSSNSLAVDQAGVLWGWGFGNGGTNASSAVPTPKGLSGVTAIADSASQWLAVVDGRVFQTRMLSPGAQGAGGGAEGRYGFETVAPWSESSGLVAGLDGVTAVAAGVPAAVALRADGTVWAFDEYRAEWLTATPARPIQPLRQVPGMEGAIDVSAGGSVGLALLSDGGVVQWTAQDPLALDAGGLPSPVTGLPAIRSLPPGGWLAISTTGALWRFGPSGAPVAVSGLRDVVSASLNAHQGFAVDSTGKVFTFPLLADDAGVLAASPLEGLPPMRAIAASGHVLATGLDGTLYSWGDDFHGQLGDGTVSP